MERPQVYIIQDQQIETNNNPEILGWEAEQLLRKYGYQSQNQPIQEIAPVDNGLTFEQMVAQDEAKKREQELRRQHQMGGPRPITFDGRYDYETRYSSDGDTGFGFKIEITTDMKLHKY